MNEKNFISYKLFSDIQLIESKKDFIYHKIASYRLDLDDVSEIIQLRDINFSFLLEILKFFNDKIEIIKSELKNRKRLDIFHTFIKQLSTQHFLYNSSADNTINSLIIDILYKRENICNEIKKQFETAYNESVQIHTNNDLSELKGSYDKLEVTEQRRKASIELSSLLTDFEFKNDIPEIIKVKTKSLANFIETDISNRKISKRDIRLKEPKENTLPSLGHILLKDFNDSETEIKQLLIKNNVIDIDSEIWIAPAGVVSLLFRELKKQNAINCTFTSFLKVLEHEFKFSGSVKEKRYYKRVEENFEELVRQINSLTI